MLEFKNYSLDCRKDYSKLRVDSIVHFDDKTESYSNGTPLCWDLSFLSRICIENYSIYHICIKTISNGNYNSVTDFKKIWKLNGIKQGIYDNSYLNKSGKVYLGITQAQGIDGFMLNHSSLIVLVPKDNTFHVAEIFNLFAKVEYDFILGVNNTLLLKLYSSTTGAIVLYYCTTNETSLTIVGKNAENLFSNSDILNWEAKRSDSIYRIPV